MELNLSTFPRWVRGEGKSYEDETSLHVFSDASEKGYGAVAYIRTELADGRFRSRLLMARARVAPLKTVTIPRLEMSAAVLAVRISRGVA